MRKAVAPVNRQSKRALALPNAPIRLDEHSRASYRTHMLALQDFSYADSPTFNLTIGADTCAGLAGPSGSGKTRLLRAICDLDPWRGSMQLAGTHAHHLPAPEWRRRIGYLPAEAHWWFDTVGPHFPQSLPFPPTFDWESMGFEADVARWPISRLSSGEKQRLAVLRLLCRKPQALLLDEPTAHLDPESVQNTEAILTRYRTRYHVPVLWVAHQQEQLERVAHTHYEMQANIPRQIT